MKSVAVLIIALTLFSAASANADEFARSPKVDARLGFSFPLWNLTATSQKSESFEFGNEQVILPAMETRFALHYRQLFLLELDGYFFWHRVIYDWGSYSEEYGASPDDFVSASHIRIGAMLSSARKQMPERGWTRDGALTAGYGLVYQNVDFSYVSYDDPQTPYDSVSYVQLTSLDHCLSFALSFSATYWLRHAGVFLELYVNYDVSVGGPTPTFEATPGMSADTMAANGPEHLQMFRFGFAVGVAFR